MRPSSRSTDRGRSPRKEEKARNQDQGRESAAFSRGNYHNDYSPRYGEAYDIYEKARKHVRDLRRNHDRDS